jgi:hypothetical protein
MVVSLRFGAACAIGENAARDALELVGAFDRLQPMPARVNETGMAASERVHIREIVVIFAVHRRMDHPAHPA